MASDPVLTNGLNGSMSSPHCTGAEGAPRPTKPTVSQILEPTRVPTGTRLHFPSNPSKSSAKAIPVSRNGLVVTASERDKTRAVDDLHPEILITIFELAVARFDHTVNNFGRLVSLTHVSRRWREVLLNSGRIWSNIHIRGQDLVMLKTQTARCQQAPLLVSFTLPSRACNTKEFNNVRKATKLIRKLRNQVERLEIHISCQNFLQHLGCEWPNLKEFVWVDTCPMISGSHGRIHVHPVNSGLPRLKNLSIEGGTTCLMNVATQLTTFKLTGPINLESSDLINFFRRNASLELIQLNNLSVSKPSRSRREEPIKLPYLTKLTIHDAAVGCVLSLLNLPSLKQLRVLSHGERNPWLDTHWFELCPQLAITNLEAQYFTPRPERIVVVGSSGLDTRSLWFTESFIRTQGSALFRALAYASLSSVTSLSLINGMPEQSSEPFVSGIHALIEHLPRVERLSLCPSHLALQVALCLRDDSGLCPELRELQVTITLTRWMCIFRAVCQAVKDRGGTERRLRRVECLPNGSEQERETLRVKWDGSWRDRGLDRYIGDE